MIKQKKPSQPNRKSEEERSVYDFSNGVTCIEESMIECRNKANEKLAEFDFRLYFQRVGNYAYLRWRGANSVISTREMRKRIASTPDCLMDEIETINREAEELNLQHSMQLKIQKANVGS